MWYLKNTEEIRTCFENRKKIQLEQRTKIDQKTLKTQTKNL